MENIHDAISRLERMDKYILKDEYRYAIEFAVNFMKSHCEKPALDERVYSISYYRPYRTNWEYYKHVPTGERLGSMKIGDLVELVKSGALDNDKFESLSSDRQRRLDSGYVLCIKSMLISNGYMTREEAFKEV